MRKQNRKTFERLCVELDATLLYARVRIAFKQGLGVSTIAKRFNLTAGQVKNYLCGAYCVAKRPSFPKRLCPDRSAVWGVPVYRTSCSETGVRRNSRFHRDSYR